MRGIDHVGLTVPDIEQATAFFVEAFDAEVLYDALRTCEAPRSGPGLWQRLGVAVGTVQRAIRMLALPDGPGIELFEYAAVDQRGPAVPSDLGLQHLAFYVDDLDRSLERVLAAGARRLADPMPLPFPESGERNRFVYVVPPWGGRLELVSYADPQPYEQLTAGRRWRPRPSSTPVP